MAQSPWRSTALRERAKENTMARASPRTKALQRAKLEENRREKMEKARVRKVTKRDQREEELENNPRAKEKERNNVMFVAIQDTMHGIAGNRFEMFHRWWTRIYGAGISCVISRWHVERVTFSACVSAKQFCPGHPTSCCKNLGNW